MPTTCTTSAWPSPSSIAAMNAPASTVVLVETDSGGMHTNAGDYFPNADGFNHPGNAGDYRTGLMGNRSFNYSPMPTPVPATQEPGQFPGRRRPRQVPGRLPRPRRSDLFRVPGQRRQLGPGSGQRCLRGGNQQHGAQSGNQFTMTAASPDAGIRREADFMHRIVGTAGHLSPNSRMRAATRSIQLSEASNVFVRMDVPNRLAVPGASEVVTPPNPEQETYEHKTLLDKAALTLAACLLLPGVRRRPRPPHDGSLRDPDILYVGRWDRSGPATITVTGATSTCGPASQAHP